MSNATPEESSSTTPDMSTPEESKACNCGAPYRFHSRTCPLFIEIPLPTIPAGERKLSAEEATSEQYDLHNALHGAKEDYAKLLEEKMKAQRAAGELAGENDEIKQQLCAARLHVKTLEMQKEKMEKQLAALGWEPYIPNKGWDTQPPIVIPEFEAMQNAPFMQDEHPAPTEEEVQAWKRLQELRTFEWPMKLTPELATMPQIESPSVVVVGGMNFGKRAAQEKMIENARQQGRDVTVMKADGTSEVLPGYDMSIHSNPDARAWAEFFVKTVKEVADKRSVSECEKASETLNLVHDTDYMHSWFANAMMAVEDHLNRQLQKGAGIDRQCKEWRDLEEVAETFKKQAQALRKANEEANAQIERYEDREAQNYVQACNLADRIRIKHFQPETEWNPPKDMESVLNQIAAFVTELGTRNALLKQQLEAAHDLQTIALQNAQECHRQAVERNEELYKRIDQVAKWRSECIHPTVVSQALDLVLSMLRGEKAPEPPKEELPELVPPGYEMVTEGLTQEGDEYFSLTRSEWYSAYNGVPEMVNAYHCVIRKKK